MNLVPFSGVAFLWFIGVIRDRLGAYEDRFFATIFLGSGILFLAMFFASAAVGGGGSHCLGTGAREVDRIRRIHPRARTIAAQLMNVYAHKMAGMFMFATATLIARTRILPRWTAILGFVLAVLLMLTSHFVDWLGLAFPLWVFILGLLLLVEDLRGPYAVQGQPGGAGVSGEGARKPGRMPATVPGEPKRTSFLLGQTGCEGAF